MQKESNEWSNAVQPLRESNFIKGGLNTNPMTPRPMPPAAQRPANTTAAGGGTSEKVSAGGE
jgi:hypothetical protein